MNRLKEHLISLESLKSVVPNLISSSKEKVNKAFSSVTATEADYILKTENTEKELIDLLLSKMDIEIILGLKFILGVKNKLLLYFLSYNFSLTYNQIFKNIKKIFNYI